MADFTKEQIKAALISRGVALPDDTDDKAEESSAVGKFLQDKLLGNASNPTGFQKIGKYSRDFAGGVMRGVQNLDALLGESGQAIGEVAAPLRKYVPEWAKVFPEVDIREQLGLKGDNQVDLGKMIASKNPNPLVYGGGQLAPAISAGGKSILGQMVANGLWGAVQAQPEEGNNSLTQGRANQGLMDAGITGALGVAGKEIAAGLPYVRGALSKVGEKLNKPIEYLRPDKSAKEFLQTLGSGTKEENAQSLARDIQKAHQEKLTEALSHKEPVYEREGNSNIYNVAESSLPEGNLDKVAHYVAPGEKATPTQLDKLGVEIKKFRKSNDFDEFHHNVGEIFNSKLDEKQIANLEEAMSLPTTHDSEFLALADKHSKLIEGDTLEAFEKFKRKPTLNNADDLQSALGKDIGFYSDKAKKGTLERWEGREQEKLQKLRDTLKSEMEGHLERVDPKLAEENRIFTEKYRENVTPYNEEEVTKEITNESKRVREKREKNPNLPYNITSTQMGSFFGEPSRAASQIAGDIGESGRNKILYNLLANDLKPDAMGLANAILEAKQAKGYQRYITPEMEKMANQLIKRAKWRKFVNWGAGITGGGLAGGAAYEGGRKLMDVL